MSRKDYKAVAEIIKRARVIKEGRVYDILDGAYVIDQLCNMFKVDNPLFNAEKFITACK
jgi:hypothetical protein